MAKLTRMPPKDIVVIGASAGGVQTLTHLVSGLSPQIPAALFVVLHIGVHRSILPAILRDAGPLPAEHAQDGCPIENGHIYVAPPDHHLLLSPGHMHITRGPKENNARPSINTLFRTAASAYGSRVAGVVLTGALNDGTVGLWEIKRHGGVTIVQSPDEAAYPSMPLSALDNVEIDHIVGVSEMSSLLLLLAKGEIIGENGMKIQPHTKSEGETFSGITCPECRGPLWESEYGALKQFNCLVGHKYSFDVLVEQHAVTTERTLWAAVLALEEEMILLQRAAGTVLDSEERGKCEMEAERKGEQASRIREMLTQAEPSFRQP